MGHCGKNNVKDMSIEKENFNKIITEISPKLRGERSTQVQEPLRTSKGEDQRIQFLHHITVKALTIEKPGNYIKNYKREILNYTLEASPSE